MRKIVITEFVSLDGIIEAPGGPEKDGSPGFELAGWTVKYFDAEVLSALSATFDAPFDMLMGRRTYEIFAAHWPGVAAKGLEMGMDEGEVALARKFDAATKYVATHRPESLSWFKSEALGADVVGRLRELKSQQGPRLLVQGSAMLSHMLLANDLVDEVRLLVYPVVLGKGKRLFVGGAAPSAFKLVTSSVSPGGVLALVYERSGEVQLGSFGP